MINQNLMTTKQVYLTIDHASKRRYTLIFNYYSGALEELEVYFWKRHRMRSYVGDTAKAIVSKHIYPLTTNRDETLYEQACAVSMQLL